MPSAVGALRLLDMSIASGSLPRSLLAVTLELFPEQLFLPAAVGLRNDMPGHRYTAAVVG